MTWTEVVTTPRDDNASPFERVEAAARLRNFARRLDDAIAVGFDALEVDSETFSETARLSGSFRLKTVDTGCRRRGFDDPRRVPLAISSVSVIAAARAVNCIAWDERVL